MAIVVPPGGDDIKSTPHRRCNSDFEIFLNRKEREEHKDDEMSFSNDRQKQMVFFAIFALFAV
jgi:hypothetical protein